MSKTCRHWFLGPYASLGTSITVFGTIAPWDAVDGPPTSKYVVDGGNDTDGIGWTGEWTMYSAPNVSDGQWLPNRCFYQSPSLKEGFHQLNVSHHSGGRFSVDYVQITTSRRPKGIGHPIKAAVIVGVVLASFAMLLLATLALFFWRRRHKLRKVQEDPSLKESLLYTPRKQTPYNILMTLPDLASSTIPSTENSTTLSKRLYHHSFPLHSNSSHIASTSTQTRER
jgi:hypothetical protein